MESNTTKKICDVAAIVGNVVGAFFVAISQDKPYLAVIGYVFFLMGCAASLWLLKHSNASKSLIFITLYFTVMNVVGIVTRLYGH